MTNRFGGLRARLIRESLYQMLWDSLDVLDWFDAGRKHQPVQFLSTGVDDREAVVVNTAVLVDWDFTEEYDELGTLLSDHRQTYYVDFYPENDAIGLHLVQDIKDILGGRVSAIGRTMPNLPVYDYSQVTPPLLFYCRLEDPIIDRPTTFERPWMRYFRTIRFDVVDSYGTDND